MEGKLAAAIELTVQPVLLGKLLGAVFAVALFEVRRQPDYAAGPADLLAEGVDALGVLVARDRERRTEIVKAVFFGQLRALQKPQAEAFGAASAALRLVLQSRGAGKIVLVLPAFGQDADLLGQAHLLDQLDLGGKAARELLLRIEVGVVPEQRHVEIAREILQHRGRARAAAVVQQHARALPSALFDDPVQFSHIVSLVHGTILPQHAEKSHRFR